jgi:hypothetical protein
LREAVDGSNGALLARQGHDLRMRCFEEAEPGGKDSGDQASALASAFAPAPPMKRAP